MALRRESKALQSRQPVHTPLHRRQFCRIPSRGQHQLERDCNILLVSRPRALPRPLRHALPTTPYQREAPERPPPRLLPLRGRSQHRERGMALHHR